MLSVAFSISYKAAEPLNTKAACSGAVAIKVEVFTSPFMATVLALIFHWARLIEVR